MFSAYHRVGEHRYQQRIGLDFEDFSPGQRFRHRPGLTVSQQDNVDEALDTLNGAMLHFDAHYAAATTWQRPLMVSTLTLQRLLGMASKTYGSRRAILGFDDITMNGPLFGGDTLYAESEVLDVAPPETVTVLIRGRKADGSEVARITCRMAIEPRRSLDLVDDERFAAYHARMTARWWSRPVCGSRTAPPARPLCTRRAARSIARRRCRMPGVRSTWRRRGMCRRRSWSPRSPR